MMRYHTPYGRISREKLFFFTTDGQSAANNAEGRVDGNICIGAPFS